MDLSRLSLDQIRKRENGIGSELTELVVSQARSVPARNPQELLHVPKNPASNVSYPPTAGNPNIVLHVGSSVFDGSNTSNDFMPIPMEVSDNYNNSKIDAILQIRRRRRKPVKFPDGPKKHLVTMQTPKLSSSKNHGPTKMRGSQCGCCPGCQLENCGKCAFCKDMPEFGGSGKMKQKCKLRVCKNFQHRIADKCALHFQDASQRDSLIDVPLTSTSSFDEAVTCAMKQLRIDEANLGTKLKTRSATKTSAATSLISQSLMQANPSKLLVGNNSSLALAVCAAKKSKEVQTVTLAKVSRKRSSDIQLGPSTIKKVKIASEAHPPPTTLKSVSFNLKPKKARTPTLSGFNNSTSLPTTLSMFQRSKKSNNSIKLKFPTNLPTDIHQWTVGHVTSYFKSMADCQDYTELFEAQEVDGKALLLLTLEVLVKYLGVKVGHALKIMNRVQELKRYQSHNFAE